MVMSRWLLKKISLLCLQHYRKILLLFLLVLGIAFFLAGRIRFDPNFLQLFSSEKGPIQLYMENLRETGAFDYLFILLEKEEGGDPKELIDFGREIADQLKSLEIGGEKAFKRVRFQKVEDEELDQIKPILMFFLTHPYLFLDRADIPKLEDRWSDEGIRKQVRKNRSILVSHPSYIMKDLILMDPFEIRWLLLEKWSQGMKGLEFDEASNFLLSKDQHSLLIMTEPQHPATDLNFSKSLIERLKETVPFPQDRGIRVSFTGAHPIAISESRVLRFDMQSSLLLSLILILILFFYAYRRLIILIFVGLPLLGGIQLTMGIASITLGTLNLLTSAFAAILAGLGIDFAIHLYDRYHQERASGAEVSSAIETTLTQTGKGIWTGAFTTIFAFAVLFFSRVQGMVELAFLISVGLLCSLFCIYFILPSFLIWTEKRKSLYSYSPLQTFGFKSFSALLKKNPWTFLLFWIGLTLFLLFFAFQIEVEKDFRNLRPKGLDSLQVFERMVHSYGGRKMEAITVHKGENLSSLLSKEGEIAATLGKYQSEGKIDSYLSLSQLIPSSEKQKEMVKVIQDSFDLERVKKNFIDELKRSRFEIAPFEPFLRGLEELKRGEVEIFSPETLMASLNQGVFERSLGNLFVKKREGYQIISHIYYEKGKLSLEQLEKEMKGVSITGAERVESEILRIVKEDLYLLTPIAFLIVLLFVFIHFRNWRITFLTMIPIVMGLLMMMGSMSLLGIRLHFVNAVVLPMIIGMGIDNGVHFMHRFLEDGGTDESSTLQKIGRAMILCSLTTMLGFGSLVTAQYPALSTMGWITILGMGFCLLTSLCFLPVLLILWSPTHNES